MIKGCQRKMVVVKGKDKSIFETAYFVLRREEEKRSLRESDMLSEATRIINENGGTSDRRACRRVRLWGFLMILGGFLMGSGATLLCVHWLA